MAEKFQSSIAAPSSTRRPSMMHLRALVIATLITCVGGFAAAADPLDANPFAPAATGIQKYRFLKASKWFVPTETLPAAALNLKNGRVVPLIDQTVWDITKFRDGYFWGRTVAVFKNPTTGQPTGAPACSRMLGSVTPDGLVHITFIGDDQTTADTAVRGIGTLTGSNRRGWRFQMQMSTGSTTVVAHWSYMDQCKSGDACETQLPGSDLSLADFLAQCD
jgi:hypothetical protein